MNLRLSRLTLSVGDLSESERFYRDVLGLPVERAETSLSVRWPDLLLALAEDPPSARGKFHFGFRVPEPKDVDAWAERLRLHDVRGITGPAMRDGMYQVFFLDPDQHGIEIYSETPSP